MTGARAAPPDGVCAMLNRKKDEKETPPAVAPEVSAGEGAGAQKAAPAPTREDVEKLTRERDEYLDLARRARADYQNLQKRVDAQIASIRREAQQRFALDMIHILDDLERALKHAGESHDAHALSKGLELVRENFLTTLADYGITPIDAQGAKFDHEFHHAIAEQPTDAAPPGTIVAVAQTGYLADGKLLRPAQVVVAKSFEENRAAESEGEAGRQSE